MEKAGEARKQRPLLARVLAVLRVSRGWNQGEMAHAAKVRPAAVSDYEQGRLVPSRATIQRLMKALGYPLAAVEKTKGFLLDLEGPNLRWGRPTHRSAPAWGSNAVERESGAVAQGKGWVEVRRTRPETSLPAAGPGAEVPVRLAPAEEEPEEAASRPRGNFPSVSRCRAGGAVEEPGDPRQVRLRVGQALAALRLSRSLSQRDLARASGIRSSSISDYERGRIEPALSTLRRLMKALGYSLAVFEETERFLRDLASGDGEWPLRPAAAGEEPGRAAS